jgi:hypothetical protein
MTFRPTYKRLGPSSQNTILFGTLANGSSRLIPPLGETCADGGFVPNRDMWFSGKMPEIGSKNLHPGRLENGSPAPQPSSLTASEARHLFRPPGFRYGTEYRCNGVLLSLFESI